MLDLEPFYQAGGDFNPHVVQIEPIDNGYVVDIGRGQWRIYVGSPRELAHALTAYYCGRPRPKSEAA